MTRRQRTVSGPARRQMRSLLITPQTQGNRRAPAVTRVVENVVEQPEQAVTRHGPPAIVVRHRRQGLANLRSVPDRDDYFTMPAPADHAVETIAEPALPAGPLAHRPILAPEVLLHRQPFRRHIEESRPYLVLSEGVRMINAHPVAVMVFWGGFTNWVLGAILAGHHVADAMRPAAAMVVLIGWLLMTLARIGKLVELQASVRAIRALSAGQAPWAVLRLSGRSRLGKRLSAIETQMLCFERGTTTAQIPIARIERPIAAASRPSHGAVSRSGDDSGSV
jgi:hypothetical protein